MRFQDLATLYISFLLTFGVEGDEITLPGIIWRAFEHGTTLNDVRLP